MRNLDLDRENRPITYTLTEDDKQRTLALYEQRALERKRSEEIDLEAVAKLVAVLRSRALVS